MAQKALEKIHWNYWAWNEQLSLEHKGHKARKRVHTHPRTHWQIEELERQADRHNTHIHTFPFIVTRRQKATAQDIVESEWQIWNFIKFPFFLLFAGNGQRAINEKRKMSRYGNSNSSILTSSCPGNITRPPPSAKLYGKFNDICGESFYYTKWRKIGSFSMVNAWWLREEEEQLQLEKVLGMACLLSLMLNKRRF